MSGFCFLMIRRPPRSTQSRSSAASDVYKRQLYARYQESSVGFQDKYFALLRAGGTKHHSELLKPFGLDATNPAFWQKGLSVISGMIDELESME